MIRSTAVQPDTTPPQATAFLPPVKPMDQMQKNLSLRPITEADMPFLFQLYASTRAHEMAMIPWGDQEKQQFLAMQFRAQHTYYTENYKNATFDVICWAGQPIGRLYVDEWLTELRIIDIALLPQYRNHGIGSYYLKALMQRASNDGKGISIHVEHNNPAMALYTRLGFQKIDETGIYHLMEWGIS
ncbi:MAG: N-acetyltransferase [Chloroflexota bacterium]